MMQWQKNENTEMEIILQFFFLYVLHQMVNSIIKVLVPKKLFTFYSRGEGDLVLC